MATTEQRHNIIIGTAGHVDHGKTALIQRLTGINADRLQEEQARGLTIDLGFAWFDLPSGAHAGIVDVPGHERFVKNMLAGATGIDLFLLVVAADEGVMPQTREHLSILQVLEIETGIVVITKADLVEEDLLELVQEDIADSLKDTPFERAPMVATSAKTGQGFDDLIRLMDEVAVNVKPRDIAGPVRMQLDRSFSMKGFGTVVTGSLIRGKLRVDEELEILPSGLRTRVRSLEIHGAHLGEVPAPARVGVNVAGIDRDEVQRGDQLIAPGSMSPSWMLDVRMRLANQATRPLVYRERVRIHHGAAEVLGRVVLLDADELVPGQDGLAQLRLESPIAAAPDDHFVVRRYSPAYTIGGGIVLDPSPTRHRRREDNVLERLRTLESGAGQVRALDWMRAHASTGFSASQLATGMQLDQAQSETLIDEMSDAGDILQLAPGRYLDARSADSFVEAIQSALTTYHAQNNLAPAMPTNRLQSALGNPPAELLQWALGKLRDEGVAAGESAGWRLSDHEVRLDEAQERAIAELEEKAAAAGMSPLSRKEAEELLGAHGPAAALLELALQRGKLINVSDFVMSREALAKGAQDVFDLYKSKGPLAISDIRDLWGNSRKFVVPIAEYLDSTGFTRRAGNDRNVTRAPGPREGAG